MTTLKDLEKDYLGREFYDGGGATTEEYEGFQKKFFSYLNRLCMQNGWTLIKKSKGHYELSAFIKNHNSHYVYLSISDVRYFKDEWYKHILIRSAKDAKDYRGGHNNYTDLPSAAQNIARIFSFIERKAE